MKTFWPSMTQSSPSLRALVWIERTSLPPLGSVTARALPGAIHQVRVSALYFSRKRAPEEIARGSRISPSGASVSLRPGGVEDTWLDGSHLGR
jgi:hypothetical protein